jgi:hypothetical protein
LRVIDLHWVLEGEIKYTCIEVAEAMDIFSEDFTCWTGKYNPYTTHDVAPEHLYLIIYMTRSFPATQNTDGADIQKE